MAPIQKHSVWKVAAAILLCKGKPMHYREVSNLIQKSKMSQLSGKTPEQTVGRDMRKHLTFFESNRGTGFYSIKKSVEKDRDILAIVQLLREQEIELNGNIYTSNTDPICKPVKEPKIPDISQLDNDIDNIISNPDIIETEKIGFVLNRIGQGEFRKALIRYWNACSVTGYDQTNLLRAAHIKPWCKCSNEERLDSFNGFLLIPNLDIAFDEGLITFENSGNIIISNLFDNPDKLGIHPQMRIHPNKLDDRHKKYLEYHREKIFRAKFYTP